MCKVIGIQKVLCLGFYVALNNKVICYRRMLFNINDLSSQLSVLCADYADQMGIRLIMTIVYFKK